MGFWNQKTFCLITGASKGIGKTIAIEFAKKVAPDSMFLLLARSGPQLEETKTEILTLGFQCNQIITAEIDLSQPDAAQYLALINSALKTSGQQASDFDLSILVHNAGSLGNVHLRVTQMEDLNELRSYYDLNLISLILLTSQYAKVFGDESKQRSIINISSLGALQPFKTWSSYCTGKAARDMVLRSIAAEDPSIATLNYAPGPVDTDIYTEAINRMGDDDTRKSFSDCKTSGQILTPIQTITKLVKVLGEGKFTKGEHVDYFDLE